MIKISYHDSVKDVQAKFATAEELEPLFQSPFDRLDWFKLIENGAKRVLYACAQEDGNRAILALEQDGGRLSSLRNWYAFIWRPLLSAGTTGSTLITRLAQDLKGSGHRVTMEPLPNEDGSADLIARTFADAGWRVEVSQCDTNHVLHLNGRNFAEYWAQRPGPLRTTLLRKSAKVTTRVLKTFDQDAWALYEDIYARSWKPTEDNPHILSAFARDEGNAGRLRLGLAFKGDIAVAAQFWTVEKGKAYIHKLAHLEDFKSLSAGTTLSAALFEHVIDHDDVTSVDFGTGHQPYKSDWMEDTRPRYRIDCLNIKKPAAWLDLCKLAYHRSRLNAVPMLAHRPNAGYTPATFQDAQGTDESSDPLRSGNGEKRSSPMSTHPAQSNDQNTDAPHDEEKKADLILKSIISDVLAIDAESVNEFGRDTGLFGHLPELDSMAVAGLLTEMEDRFGFVIEDDDIDGEMLETYGGLLDFATFKLAEV